MKVSRTSPSALQPDHPWIDRVQLRVGNPVDRQSASRVPPRQAGEPRPSLPGPLGNPDQEDDLIPRPDSPGVEHPDDLEIVAGGGTSSGRSRSWVASRRTVIDRPPPWASASACAGHREGIPAVCLGHDPLVIAVPDPGDLVLHHGPEQPAVERRLRLTVPERELDDLVGVYSVLPLGSVFIVVGVRNWMRCR